MKCGGSLNISLTGIPRLTLANGSMRERMAATRLRRGSRSATARRRMSRTSSSIECPCLAARLRKRRLRSISRLRIVMLAMDASLRAFRKLPCPNVFGVYRNWARPTWPLIMIEIIAGQVQQFTMRVGQVEHGRWACLLNVAVGQVVLPWPLGKAVLSWPLGISGGRPPFLDHKAPTASRSGASSKTLGNEYYCSYYSPLRRRGSLSPWKALLGRRHVLEPLE